jgi:hypothetical protein
MEIDKAVPLYVLRGQMREYSQKITTLQADSSVIEFELQKAKLSTNDALYVAALRKQRLEEMKGIEGEKSVIEDVYNLRVAKRVFLYITDKQRNLDEIKRFEEEGYLEPEVHQIHTERLDAYMNSIKVKLPVVWQKVEELDAEPKDESRTPKEDLLNFLALLPKKTWKGEGKNRYRSSRSYDLKKQGDNSIFTLLPEDLSDTNISLITRTINTFNRHYKYEVGDKTRLNKTTLCQLNLEEIPLIRNMGRKSLEFIRLLREAAIAER